MKIDAACLQLSSSKGQDTGIWAFGVSLSPKRDMQPFSVLSPSFNSGQPLEVVLTDV